MSSIVPLKKGQQEFDTQYSDVAQYGRVQFWDERYAKETEPFEWYYPYANFKEIINDYIKKDAAIFIAGTGSSNLPEDLIKDGYEDVTAGDISRVIMNQLGIRYRDTHPEIKFFQGNLTDTNLPAASFNAIIDKALMDTFLCSDVSSSTVAQYVFEVERLLKDDGVFIVISHGNPEQRLQYLEQYDIDEPYYTPWYIDVQAIVKPKAFDDEELEPDDPDSLYWIYICAMNSELLLKKRIKEGKILVKERKDTRKKAPIL